MVDNGIECGVSLRRLIPDMWSNLINPLWKRWHIEPTVQKSAHGSEPSVAGSPVQRVQAALQREVLHDECARVHNVTGLISLLGAEVAESAGGGFSESFEDLLVEKLSFES